MSKSKKRRTVSARPARDRTAKMTKVKNRRKGTVRPQHGPTVNRISVHHEIIKRRFEGGAPATPEAYARAAEQWQQLRGAVLSRTQTSPTPIKPSVAVASAANETENEQKPS